MPGYPSKKARDTHLQATHDGRIRRGAYQEPNIAVSAVLVTVQLLRQEVTEDPAATALVTLPMYARCFSRAKSAMTGTITNGKNQITTRFSASGFWLACEVLLVGVPAQNQAQ